MKYVVAPGACFSNRGKTFEAGAVITADMFDPKSAFDKFVKKGMIIPAEGSDKSDKASEEAEADKEKTEEVTEAETENEVKAEKTSKKGKK